MNKLAFQTEKELIARLRADDQFAFEALFYKYKNKVKGFVLKFAPSKVDMRKNGGNATSEAVELVNQVRSRAFEDPADKLYTTTTLTMDALLAERGWEFAGEGWRRNDQVRFGDFTKGRWTFKDSDDPDFRNVFPIPQSQLNANPNLTQNTGY